MIVFSCISYNSKAQNNFGTGATNYTPTGTQIVNNYYTISTVTSSGTNVILSLANGVPSASMPAVNDLVLLIVMEGASGEVGNFTFGKVSLVSGTTCTVTPKYLPISSPQNSFAFLSTNPTNKKQLIVVPQYGDLNLCSGQLSATAYDEANGTGGILSFFVSGTLTYATNSINLDGKGFPGRPELLTGTVPGTKGSGGTGGTYGVDCADKGTPGGYDHQVFNSGVCGGGDGGSRGNCGAFIPLDCVDLTPGMGCDARSSNVSFYGSGIFPKRIALGGGGYKGRVGHPSYGGGGGGGGVSPTNNGETAPGFGGESGYGGTGSRGGGAMIYAANHISFCNTNEPTPFISVKGINGLIGSAGTNATGRGGHGGVGGGGGGNGPTGGNGGKGGGGGAGGFILHILGSSVPSATLTTWSDKEGGSSPAAPGGQGGFPGNNATGSCTPQCPSGNHPCTCNFLDSCNRLAFDWLQNIGSTPGYSTFTDALNNKVFYSNGAYTCVITDAYCFGPITNAKTLQCQNSNPASIPGVLPTEVRRVTITPSPLSTCSFSINDLFQTVLNGGNYSFDPNNHPGYITTTALNCSNPVPLIHPRWDLTCDCNRAQPIRGADGVGTPGDFGEDGGEGSEVMNEVPVVDTATSTPSQVCSGKSATLHATGTYTFTWMPGSYIGNLVDVYPTTTTIYTVTATDIGGATATRTVQVIVNPLPNISATASLNSVVAGQSTSLTASGAANYTWQPSGINTSTATLAPLFTTTYTVTGTNTNGCSNTSTKTISVTPFNPVGNTLQYTIDHFEQSGNYFTYEVHVKNTGSSDIKLRSYAFGLNHNPLLANSGTITHSFMSRDGIFNSLPPVIPSYQSSLNHLRATTNDASIGNEAILVPGNSYLLAKMKVESSAGFPFNCNLFDGIAPLNPIQITTQPGRNQCLAGVRLNYTAGPGVLYALYGTGNTLVGSSLPYLTAIADTPSTGFILNPPSSVVNVHAVIQSYWDGLSMAPVLANQGQPSFVGACDTITVELHNSTSPYAIVASANGIIWQDGDCDVTFSSLSGSYYIVVKHRNAIQTWSAMPVAFGPGITSYDFTTAATQAYGSNQVEVSPGVWAFYSGDVTTDENMDLLDLNLVEADISNFAYGYLATDINGDGNVDLLDTPALEENIGNFVFSNRP